MIPIPINTKRIRNKILSMTYRPSKSNIFNSKLFKSFDDINELLEDELPRLGGKKRSKAGDSKADSAGEDKE